MSKRLRIIYVGDLTKGGTCHQRLRALMDLNHEVIPIDTFSKESRYILNRIKTKLLGPIDTIGVNKQIVEAAQRFEVDVLWVDKGLTISLDTMEKVRDLRHTCRIVGYSPDDMFARHNQSQKFFDHLKMYDIYFTTKSYGVAELKCMGIKDVVFVGNAFCSYTHRPMPMSRADRERLGGPVGFIGTWEQDRATSMYNLACSGISVRIWGNMWEHNRLRHSKFEIMGRAIYGDDYATALCAFDINLCFLRKINRDLQTTRSIEIPACGAFMLAERTDEHMALFEEGKEAEFFDNDDELLDKARYYLKHEDQRKRIATAGRERCLKSGYSNHDRIKQMLAIIEDLHQKD